jgi:hypothetical protein
MSSDLLLVSLPCLRVFLIISEHRQIRLPDYLFDILELLLPHRGGRRALLPVGEREDQVVEGVVA